MMAFYPVGRRPIKVTNPLCDLGSPVAGRIARPGPRLRSVDQFPINLGAHGGFNGRVVNTAENARFRTQFDPIAGLDVAFDDAVQHDIGDDHRALDAALLAHRQQGAARPLRP